MNQALILVDIQNDFLPNGALPIPRGDEVIEVANRLARSAPRDWVVVASQDWHPPDHGSFASQYPGRSPFELIELAGLEQVLWPDHCVQDSHGALLASRLDTRRIERIFTKGVDRSVDSYSAFFDNARRNSTGLLDWLRDRGVGRVHVLGLATDYCVKATALDAVSLGFETWLVADGCRGAEVAAGDSDRAIAAMVKAGVRVVRADAALRAAG